MLGQFGGDKIGEKNFKDVEKNYREMTTFLKNKIPLI